MLPCDKTIPFLTRHVFIPRITNHCLKFKWVEWLIWHFDSPYRYFCLMFDILLLSHFNSIDWFTLSFMMVSCSKGHVQYWVVGVMIIRGTIWSKRSMCMFEHVFNKFQNTRLTYMTNRIYGVKTRCKWLNLNDTSPNDAQTSSPRMK